MTRVFDRQVAGPRTRAMVLGIGRYPTLPPDKNIQACVDSARAVVTMLVDLQDELIQPLASIDCILSEPGIPRDSDTTPNTGPFDPRIGNGVTSATADNVVNSLANWAATCEEGDNLIVYACGHGVIEGQVRNLLVLEDWAETANLSNYVLDIGGLARCLAPARQAASAWLFFDCCSTFEQALADSISGVQGRQAVICSPAAFVKSPGNTLAIVGSPPGGTAGTDQTGIAYFTQALLLGIQQCMVDRAHGKWLVSSAQLATRLEVLSRVAIGRQVLPTTLLTPTTPKYLLPINQPLVPILVRTRPEAVLRMATSADISMNQPPMSQLRVKTDKNQYWRCALDLTHRDLAFNWTSPGQPAQRHEFWLDLPCVDVEVI